MALTGDVINSYIAECLEGENEGTRKKHTELLVLMQDTEFHFEATPDLKLFAQPGPLKPPSSVAPDMMLRVKLTEAESRLFAQPVQLKPANSDAITMILQNKSSAKANVAKRWVHKGEIPAEWGKLMCVDKHSDEKTALDATPFYCLTGKTYNKSVSSWDDTINDSVPCAAAAAWIDYKGELSEAILHNTNVRSIEASATGDMTLGSDTRNPPSVRHLRVVSTATFTVREMNFSASPLCIAYISVHAIVVTIDARAFGDLPFLTYAEFRADKKGTVGANAFRNCPALKRVRLFGPASSGTASANNEFAGNSCWDVDTPAVSVIVNDSLVVTQCRPVEEVKIPYSSSNADAAAKMRVGASTVRATGAVVHADWLNNLFDNPDDVSKIVLENIVVRGPTADKEDVSIVVTINPASRQADTDIETLTAKERSVRGQPALLDVFATDRRGRMHSYAVTHPQTASTAMTALCWGQIDLTTFRYVGGDLRGPELSTHRDDTILGPRIPKIKTTKLVVDDNFMANQLLDQMEQVDLAGGNSRTANPSPEEKLVRRRQRRQALYDEAQKAHWLGFSAGGEKSMSKQLLLTKNLKYFYPGVLQYLLQAGRKETDRSAIVTRLAEHKFADLGQSDVEENLANIETCDLASPGLKYLHARLTPNNQDNADRILQENSSAIFAEAKLSLPAPLSSLKEVLTIE